MGVPLTEQDRKSTLALIVPSRNRLEYLLPRVPIWAKAGFDEIVVVNTPGDLRVAQRIRQLCESTGVTYTETQRTFRDLRARARNVGARAASTAWVYFCDDDVGVVAYIDLRAFEQAAEGRDWLAGERGDIVVVHRRAAFLSFGGYPEDMVASEDTIMSNRARRHGRGGPLGRAWTRSVSLSEVPRSEPLNRVRAHLWYSITLPLFLIRTPRFREALISDAHRTLSLGKRALMGDVESLVQLVVYAIGRLFSPIHLIAVLVRLGRRGFLREPEGSWQDARPGGVASEGEDDGDH